MRNEILSIYKTNNFIYFIILFALCSLANFYIYHFYISEELFFSTYSNQLGTERIVELFKMGQRLSYINYIIIPISLIIKIVYNTIIISISSFIIIDELNLKSNFNICLKSESIFLFMLLAKIICFEFFITVNTIDDLNFVPLSLKSFFKNSLPKWLIYPLQTINLWEILFIIAVSYLFSIINNVSFKKGLLIAGCAYVLGVTMWVTFVMFLTIQFS